MQFYLKVFCKTAAVCAIATGVVQTISGSAEAAALAAAADIPPSFQLPELTGPYQVGTTSYDFVDSSRNDIYAPNPTDKRELMVQVFYPGTKEPGAIPAAYLEDSVARASAPSFGVPPDNFVNLVHSFHTHAFSGTPISTVSSSYPVLLFSHGFNTLPQLYTLQAEELASHGYIVANITHTYDSPVTKFPDGRIALQAPIFNKVFSDPESPETINIIGKDIDVRAADARFVLNELEHLNASDPQSLLTGHLDLNRVGIFGHSLGGATAAEAMLLDSRFKAGIEMDGTLLGDAVKDGLQQPFMLINSDLVSLDPRRQSFYEKLKNDAYNLTIKGTQHLSYTDLPLLFPLVETYYSPQLAAELKNANFGLINAKRGAKIIDDYTLAFFDKYLNSQNSPLLNAPNPNYPEVQFSSRYSTPTEVPEPSGSLWLLAFAGCGLLFKRLSAPTP